MFDIENDDETLEVQMAPLIDCVFLLLMFFLVTSVLKKVEFEVPLNLPAAARTIQAAPAPELILISVDALGQTFVDGTPVTNDQFAAQLRQAVEVAGDELRVRIDGDEAAPYAGSSACSTKCTRSASARWDSRR